MQVLKVCGRFRFLQAARSICSHMFGSTFPGGLYSKEKGMCRIYMNFLIWDEAVIGAGFP